MSDAEIVVDWDQCEGNAVCESILPQVFQVDDDNFMNVLMPNPPEELLDKVQEAVDMCPKRALALRRGGG
ncbi:MAG TPA: ferredoxin [Mycobacteriales bacterium]|nr:ferredoxin [Mycobacteriales bacterium]